MDEAEQCQRIALMRDGKMIALNSPAGMKKEAFPFPLLEFSSKGEGLLEEKFINEIKCQEEIKSLSPYGLSWHGNLRREYSIADLKKNFPNGFIRQK